MNHLSPDYPKLEAAARQEIDQKLEAAGWVIQDKKRLNLYESMGVAVREMDTGPADYMLFVDSKACGVVKPKRKGANLGNDLQQHFTHQTHRTFADGDGFWILDERRILAADSRTQHP